MVGYKFSKGKYYIEAACYQCKKKAKTAAVYFDNGDVHSIKEFECELRGTGWQLEKEVILPNGNKDLVDFCCEDCYNQYLKGAEGEPASANTGESDCGLSFTLSNNGKYYVVSGYDGSVSSVVIPEKYQGFPVKDIEESAFSLNKKIKEIVISKNITKLGKARFKSCIYLEKVTLPKEMKSIGNYAFYNCAKLTDVIIPEAVKTIGNYAFSECKSIENLVLPAAFEAGHRAFSHSNIHNCFYNGTLTDWLNLNLCPECDLLFYTENLCFSDENGEVEYRNRKYTVAKHIVIPDNVDVITSSMFSHMTTLESIEIPATTKTIGSCAFRFCKNLKNIIIHEGVESIEDYAFDCGGLIESVTIPASVKELKSLPTAKDTEIGNNLTKINNLVFFKRSGVERIFFNGTEEEWHGYELKLDPFNLDFKGVYVSDPSGDTEYGGKTYRRIELPSSKTK
jgi:hypothetical protein